MYYGTHNHCSIIIETQDKLISQKRTGQYSLANIPVSTSCGIPSMCGFFFPAFTAFSNSSKYFTATLRASERAILLVISKSRDGYWLYWPVLRIEGRTSGVTHLRNFLASAFRLRRIRAYRPDSLNAIQHGYTDKNIAADLTDVLKPVRKGHFAAITTDELPNFVKNMERNETRLYMLSDSCSARTRC